MNELNDSDCNKLHGTACNCSQFRGAAETDACCQSHFSLAPRDKQTLELICLFSRYKTEITHNLAKKVL